MPEEKPFWSEFGTYQFSKEDQELASQIRGLEMKRMFIPKPFGPVFEFVVNKNISIEAFSEFLESLPDVFELKYFKCFELKDGAAGTQVIVHKAEKDYLFYKGSHGQDTTWYAMSKSDLLNELFTYRAFQPFERISVERAIKVAALGQKARK
jgi:hypothetical protein